MLTCPRTPTPTTAAAASTTGISCAVVCPATHIVARGPWWLRTAAAATRRAAAYAASCVRRPAQRGAAVHAAATSTHTIRSARAIRCGLAASGHVAAATVATTLLWRRPIRTLRPRLWRLLLRRRLLLLVRSTYTALRLRLIRWWSLLVWALLLLLLLECGLWRVPAARWRAAWSWLLRARCARGTIAVFVQLWVMLVLHKLPSVSA